MQFTLDEVVCTSVYIALGMCKYVCVCIEMSCRHHRFVDVFGTTIPGR